MCKQSDALGCRCHEHWTTALGWERVVPTKGAPHDSSPRKEKKISKEGGKRKNHETAFEILKGMDDEYDYFLVIKLRTHARTTLSLFSRNCALKLLSGTSQFLNVL